MMVGQTTDDLRDNGRWVMKMCKVNRQEPLLMDVIHPHQITVVEIGFVADAMYDDKCKARSLGRMGNEVEFTLSSCKGLS